MGLDMYLFSIKKGVDITKIDNYQTEEVMYWRKANQIRQWFIDHLDDPVENCEYVRVPKEKLEELLQTCRTVLNEKSRAEELLPTSSGFFFGSTEYDERYFDEIWDTAKEIEKLLKEINWSEQDILYMEWW